MLALLDIQGKSNFDSLSDNIEAQVKYVYDAINSDSDYENMSEFMKKYFKDPNDIGSPAKSKEKAETSRLIRDRGNKVCWLPLKTDSQKDTFYLKVIFFNFFMNLW